MGERPTAAWVLSLIGGILGLIGGIIFAFSGTAAMMMFGPGVLTGIFAVIAYWIIIAHIIIIIGAVKIRSGEPKSVKRWGIVVLVLSILGGFNIISLIGGILALVWKPPSASA